MKPKISIILLIALFIGSSLKADEGMWLLTLLQEKKYDEMKENGLELTPEQIYDINNSSLKDAVAIFGGGCTGEIISDEGLLLTNMHCGYDYIHKHSSEEQNYLEDGFWSDSKEEELKNPGLQVRFLDYMKDVTDSIIPKLDDDMSEQARQKKVNKIGEKIAKRADKGEFYETEVKSFYGGNQYFLIAYNVYKDVRLVASPPETIGDFGSLTDNWMYPRHKADFSMFRVYMSPDGEPAEYSENNVPLDPEHVIPVSNEGTDKGDFAMILGYPGGTDRYMTSYGIKELKEIEHPNRIKIRGAKLDIMEKAMQKSDKLRLKYTSKYKGTSNYWKYSKGQMEGFNRIDLLQKRKKLEENFREWVSKKQERKEKYGNALDLLKQAYTERRPYANARQYFIESLIYGPEFTSFAPDHKQLYKELDKFFLKRDKDKVEKSISKLKSQSEEYFKNYHKPTQRKIVQELFSIFQNDIPEKFYPGAFKNMLAENNNDAKKVANYIFDNSIFTDQEKYNEFLENPDDKSIKEDPAYKLANSIRKKFREVMQKYRKPNLKYSKGHRLFIAGLKEMKENKTFYPNANFSMRLTYGNVGGYSPRDAVHYEYYTTLEGVMEKEDPDSHEFKVSDRLKKLYREKDYGRYGEDGEMHVCFITNNDITGGNSGSPVLNGKGELIGLAFDSNWEGLTGDIEYDEKMQKTVCTDIRYILWILDKYANADRLVEEMNIIHSQ